MALRTREDHFGISTGVETRLIAATSRMVSTLTGMEVQRNKAIVGANAFAHEAGIHQHGMLCSTETYEVMNPQDVGVQRSSLVLGKHSGRHALKERVEALGQSLSDEQIGVLFERFKELADKKKEIYDDDLLALIEENLAEVPDLFELVRFHTTSGTGIVPTATVVMRRRDGEEVQDAATGDGPVDAICNTVDRITGIECRLLDYHIRAITKGKDALGEVSLAVQSGDLTNRGRAVDTDIIQASAQAYVNAVNRLAARLQNGHTA